MSNVPKENAVLNIDEALAKHGIKRTPNNQRVINVFKDVMAEIAAGNQPNLTAIQEKHGYTESSARSHVVTKTKTWDALMDSYDDDIVLTRVHELMMQDEDRRTALSAADMMLKLKGRYPTKSQKQMLQDIRKRFIVEE